MSKKIIIGKEEWCAFPNLDLPAIKARVDSGAKTSSLHAFNIYTFEERGGKYVTFDIHPIQDNRKVIQSCKAEVVDNRHVKSSSGEKEKRIVIKTPITFGQDTWDIEVTLTNRDTMGYRMLLGREAMREKILINPNESFLLGTYHNDKVLTFYENIKPVVRQGLKIALLASNPELYSNKRIIEAGEEHGHEMKFINIKHCYMNMGHDGHKIYSRSGELLNNLDAVIPRIKPSMTFYGCALIRQFESLGVFCLNNSLPISLSRDKLCALQVLGMHNIPMPLTSFAHSPVDTKQIIQTVGGAPLVIKLLEGAQGKGVVLAETNKASESVINAFKSLNANILVQEFIKESLGRDIRCFVIDGKVVGSMQRESAPDDFRSNLHLGGKASPVKITLEERKIAIKAAKIMKLKVAGVDIIQSVSGPKVLEVNSSPGLEGIEHITEKDIAGLMIECIEKNIRANREPLEVLPSL